MTGSDGDDMLVGGSGADTLNGGFGTDVLEADDDEADVQIHGGPGSDTAYYDTGVDPGDHRRREPHPAVARPARRARRPH